MTIVALSHPWHRISTTNPISFFQMQKKKTKKTKKQKTKSELKNKANQNKH